MLRRGDHVELAALLVDRLESPERPMTFDDGEFWRYAPERGVWEIVPIEQIEHTVAGFAGSWIEEGDKVKQLKINDGACKGAARIARNSLCTRAGRARFADAAPGVAFRNGFVTVRGGAIELLPHDCAHMARAGLPFDYVADARHPELDAFFDDLFSDASEAERAERIALLQEFIGASLFGMAPGFQKCLVLYGEGNNGKSQVLTIARSVFPEGPAVSLSPQQWEERFRLERLCGALANFVDEMPQKEIAASEVFKGIVTGEPQTAERKHHDAFNFSPRAGHMFSTNHLPTTSDHSHGFFRRFIVLPLTRKFEGEAKVVNAGQRVVDAERAAIAAWAVEGAARVQRQQHYTEPQGAKDLADSWLRESDSVRVFVSSACCVLTKGSPERMKSSEIYREYVTWAEARKFKPVNLVNFAKRLIASGVPTTNAHNRTLYHIRALAEFERD
jgi:P4 family phage/plasmid primase-like protien